MKWISNVLYLAYRRWWLIAILVAGYWLFGDCGGRDRLLIAEGPAPAGFRELPGTLGVSSVFRSGDREFGRHYLIREGTILEVGSIEPRGTGDPSQPSRPAYVGGLKLKPSGDYGDLYEVSPNRQLAAVATKTVYPDSKDARWNSTRNLLIFELSTGKLLARIDGGGVWDIRSITWSPDNRFVAATRLKLNWGGCFIEKIAYMSGHPNTMVSYALEVFDLSGERVASMDLVSRAKWQGTRLVWGEADLTSQSLGEAHRARAVEQRNRARQAYQ